MSNAVLRWAPPILSAGCLGLLLLIVTGASLPAAMSGIVFLESFKILFLSIILEAFPFILLGILFSALLQVFVSEQWIARLTPRNPAAGVLYGSLLGLLFPLCECGMIPVVRRLIRKGLPAYIGIVYIIAGPIVNPVVFASTWSAFRTRPELAYSRMGLALAVSITVGLLLFRFMRTNPLKTVHGQHDHHHDDHAHHGHSRFSSTLAHASDEFFEMGKYLIFGALLTALIQTAVTRETLASIGDHPWFSHLFMMGFAFLLSICSTSDAFVAASFTGTFDDGSLLAFLVFGPMIDLKNTLMLLSTFRVKVVLGLIAAIGLLVLIGSWLTERLYLT
jgi:uncharacterized protein